MDEGGVQLNSYEYYLNGTDVDTWLLIEQVLLLPFFIEMFEKTM